MLKGLEIQPYCGDLCQPVIDLILPIQRQEFGVRITAEDQPDLMNIPGFYQHGCGNFWVALLGEEVVGSISLLDIGNKQAALRKMFVKQEYRGKERGIAASLLNTAVLWAQEKRVRAIYLGTVDKYHAAHRFYAKNGFTRVPRESLPESFPVMEVDSMFFTLSVLEGA